VEHRIARLWAASAFGLLAILLALAACAPAAPAQTAAPAEMTLPAVTPVDLGPGERLKVVATTNIVGDVVEEVAEDAVSLTVLMAVGQDPHSYEPTPQALAAIEDADVIFVNGLDLEEVLMTTIENTATGLVVPVSAGIEPLVVEKNEREGAEEHAEEGSEHVHANGDPHFWMNPANVIVWTQNIESVLSQADPANRQSYAASADAYRAQLEQVDAYARQQLALVPPENRKLVTDHDSLGYFADAYGFEVVGAMIPGTSTTGEASAGDVAALVDVIRAEDVPAIFIGTSASRGLQSLANTIADEVGGQVKVLPLLTGSLAPVGQPGDTYLGLIRFDVDQIVEGLAE
jgi:ABC-type Zn uptake system ZnuABC Zn-binding protein ZnuA